MYEATIDNGEWKRLYVDPSQQTPARDRPLKVRGSSDVHPSIASLQSHARWLQNEVKTLSEKAESFAKVLEPLGMDGEARAIRDIAGALTACTNFDFKFVIAGLVGWEEYLRKKVENAEQG